MGKKTGIEWCDRTGNLWWGCTEVHAGCDNCYAREFAKNRTGKDAWGQEAPRFLTKGVWGDLRRWQREAPAFHEENGRRQRVFVGSMMDVFEKPHRVVDWHGNEVDTTMEDVRRRFFEETVPDCPDLVFLLLTKRPGNITKYVPPAWLEPGGWPENVWTGTSPVDQKTADVLVPQLLRAPGRHFLSMEPLLGAVSLDAWFPEDGYYITRCEHCGWTGSSGEQLLDALWDDAGVVCHRCERETLAEEVEGVNWVIVGGESQSAARPMHPDWARSLRDQCEAAGVPFLFKQWGEWVPCSHSDQAYFDHADAGRVRAIPFDASDTGTRVASMARVGKKAAGRLLDGRTHDGFPHFG